MYLPTTYEGMRGAIAWHIGSVIIGKFDAQHAAYLSRKAVDPSYKPNPFADKPSVTKKTMAEAVAAVCADVKARKAAAG